MAIFIPDGVSAHRNQDRKQNLEVMTRVEAAGAEHRSGCKRNFDLQGESGRFRDRLPIFGHALQVKFDRLPDVVRDFLYSSASTCLMRSRTCRSLRTGWAMRENNVSRKA